MAKTKYEIIDSSYSLIDKHGEMKPTTDICLQGSTFFMLAKDCVLPTDPANLSMTYHKVNNVILRNTETDEIVFAQLRFVQPITEHCPTCGQEIKRSLI